MCIALIPSQTSLATINNVDPHYPSFITGVITPLFLQSTDFGRFSVDKLTIGNLSAFAN